MIYGDRQSRRFSFFQVVSRQYVGNVKSGPGNRRCLPHGAEAARVASASGSEGRDCRVTIVELTSLERTEDRSAGVRGGQATTIPCYERKSVCGVTRRARSCAKSAGSIGFWRKTSNPASRIRFC